MNTHLKGLIITTIGVLFVVPDSLFVRLIDADALTIVFWRGMISGGLILLGVLAFQGINPIRASLSTGWAGFLYIILVGSSAPLFVTAVTLTSVANVVFIIASMPVFAALFSRIFLDEPISKRMMLTMAGVAVGLALIAYGSGTNEIGNWRGDLMALGVSAGFAGAMTAARSLKHISMVPAIPFAYIGAALILMPFTDIWQITQWDLVVFHGLIIVVSTTLLTLGPRYISSAEVALLILLESILAPILVWWIIGEDPGPWTLIGGAIIIAVLIVSNLIVLRRR